MKVSEYIQIMKENKPHNFDLNNMWEQFYETNEQIIDVLVKSGKMTKKESERFLLVNNYIAGEIVLNWLGTSEAQICIMVKDFQDKMRILGILDAYRPADRQAHLKHILLDGDTKKKDCKDYNCNKCEDSI